MRMVGRRLEQFPSWPSGPRRLSAIGALRLALALALAPLLALSPIGPARAASGDCSLNSTQVTCTYSYTDGSQTWTVPSRVTSATFDVYGAAGGSASVGQNPGGLGGEATATLTNLSASESIILMVGGQGGTIADSCNATQAGSGGFNGGGSGGGDSCPSAGGGGASDVRIGGTDLADRVLVAGGGGGGSNSYECTSSCAYGGSGGGVNGGEGFTIGGTAAAGGGQSSGSGSGQLGQGGTGANGTSSPGVLPSGGGGGSGYGPPTSSFIPASGRATARLSSPIPAPTRPHRRRRPATATTTPPVAGPTSPSRSP